MTNDPRDEAPAGANLVRDRDVLVLLGVFLSVLALLVLGGLFFSAQPIDHWINLGAGLLLLGVGLAFVLKGRSPLGARPGSARGPREAPESSAVSGPPTASGPPGAP